MKRIGIWAVMCVLFLTVTNIISAKQENRRKETTQDQIAAAPTPTPFAVSFTPSASPTTTPISPTPTPAKPNPSPTPNAYPSPTPTSSPVALHPSQRNSTPPPDDGNIKKDHTQRETQPEITPAVVTYTYTPPQEPTPTQTPPDTIFIQHVAKSKPVTSIVAPFQTVIRHLPQNFYPPAGLSTQTNRILYSASFFFLLSGFFLLEPKFLFSLKGLVKKFRMKKSYTVFQPNIS